LPSPQIYSPSSSGSLSPLRQGEIISNVVQIHLSLSSLDGSDVAIQQKMHPLTIVISQGCDLEQDHGARSSGVTSDKVIPNILFCELDSAQKIRNCGSSINSSIWSQIRINKHERYHYLQRIEALYDVVNEGLGELCIDFKRFFTIPSDEIYRRIEIDEAKRRCYLVSPYLEHLSTRFAHFLSRIALPQDHASL